MGVLMKYVLAVLFVCVACEEDVLEEEHGEKGRTLVLDGDYRQNQWRVVETFNLDSPTWNSNISFHPEPTLDTSGAPKRRRIRKRKRRPQSEIPTQRRIRRPQLSDESRNPWKEMEDESRTRPNKRRRIIPIYDDHQSKHFAFGDREIVKNPMVEVFQSDQAILDEDGDNSAMPDLKKLLKQAGGSSLSEILQQKNLSLADLLSGQRQAISALAEQTPDDVITEYKNPVVDDSVGHQEAKPNKSEPVKSHKENIIYGVDEEEEGRVTERIFVPSHPVYYTALNYAKINLGGPQVTNMSEAKKEKTVLPITNAQQMHQKIKFQNVTNSAFAINISDLFGFDDLLKQNASAKSSDEGPVRMSIDLNEISENEITHRTPTTATTTTTTTTTTTVRITTMANPEPEKLKAITAKDEIMEILGDETAKQNLSKILATRNMTIEELVEQRERGSSQRHLADIFHNKTKEPEPKDDPHITYTYRPLSYFERRPKSQVLPLELKHDSEGDRYVASIDEEAIEDSNESKIEENQDGKKYTVTSFPTYKIEMDRKFKANFPIWKSTNGDSDDSNLPQHFPIWKNVQSNEESVVLDDSKLQRLEIAIPEATNDRLNVEEVEDYADESLIKLPYGVKSAILASLLIIGSSLLLFLTILMVFKWSQRHKQKLCYGNGWSCSKIQSPILDAEPAPRRTIRSFMNETLGRNRLYYKEPNSIWDGDKKPFQ